MSTLTVLGLWMLAATGTAPGREPVERSQCRVIAHQRAAQAPRGARTETITLEGTTITLHTRRGSHTYTIGSGPLLDPVLTQRPRRIYWLALEELCVLDPARGRARRVLREPGLSGNARLTLVGDTVQLQRFSDGTCLSLRPTARGATARAVPCSAPTGPPPRPTAPDPARAEPPRPAAP